MCDKDRSSKQGKTRGDRTEGTMPECCGAILERMKEACCDIAHDSEADPASDNGESKAAAACVPAVWRMAEACCGSLSAEERSAPRGRPA